MFPGAGTAGGCNVRSRRLPTVAELIRKYSQALRGMNPSFKEMT